MGGLFKIEPSLTHTFNFSSSAAPVTLDTGQPAGLFRFGESAKQEPDEKETVNIERQTPYPSLSSSSKSALEQKATSFARISSLKKAFGVLQVNSNTDEAFKAFACNYHVHAG